MPAMQVAPPVQLPSAPIALGSHALSEAHSIAPIAHCRAATEPPSHMLHHQQQPAQQQQQGDEADSMQLSTDAFLELLHCDADICTAALQCVQLHAPHLLRLKRLIDAAAAAAAAAAADAEADARSSSRRGSFAARVGLGEEEVPEAELAGLRVTLEHRRPSFVGEDGEGRVAARLFASLSDVGRRDARDQARRREALRRLHEESRKLKAEKLRRELRVSGRHDGNQDGVGGGDVAAGGLAASGSGLNPIFVAHAQLDAFGDRGVREGEHSAPVPRLHSPTMLHTPDSSTQWHYRSSAPLRPFSLEGGAASAPPPNVTVHPGAAHGGDAPPQASPIYSFFSNLFGRHAQQQQQRQHTNPHAQQSSSGSRSSAPPASVHPQASAGYGVMAPHQKMMPHPQILTRVTSSNQRNPSPGAESPDLEFGSRSVSSVSNMLAAFGPGGGASSSIPRRTGAGGPTDVLSPPLHGGHASALHSWIGAPHSRPSLIASSSTSPPGSSVFVPVSSPPARTQVVSSCTTTAGISTGPGAHVQNQNHHHAGSVGPMPAAAPAAHVQLPPAPASTAEVSPPFRAPTRSASSSSFSGGGDGGGGGGSFNSGAHPDPHPHAHTHAQVHAAPAPPPSFLPVSVSAPPPAVPLTAAGTGVVRPLDSFSTRSASCATTSQVQGMHAQLGSHSGAHPNAATVHMSAIVPPPRDPLLPTWRSDT